MTQANAQMAAHERRIRLLEFQVQQLVQAVQGLGAVIERERAVVQHPEEFTREWAPKWLAQCTGNFVHRVKNAEGVFEWRTYVLSPDTQELLEAAQTDWEERNPDLAAKYKRGPKANVKV